MLKQLLWILFAVIVVPLMEYFLGLQVLQLGYVVRNGLSLNDFHFDFNLFNYFNGSVNIEFFWVVSFLAFMSALYILWINVIRLHFGDRSKLKDSDGNTIDEDNITHEASKFEAKRGTLRIDFLSNGQVDPNSFKHRVDVLFDPLKKRYNKIAKKVFRVSDRKLLNTIKHYPNNGQMTRFKSGIPIVFGKNSVWVDANDNHCLVVGTTNSGKTFSYVNPLIQLCRMCGESMVINDVKGELYKAHAKTLEEDGYKVLSVNFIDPKASDHWNPLGTIIKKYRQAYYDCQEDIRLNHLDDAIELYNVLRELKWYKNKDYENDEERQNDELIIARLRGRKRILSDIIPKPNYSDAAELVADIANSLCYEKEAKDPYWSTSAMQLLEGYIYFLLEERVVTDKGYSDFMDIKLVNMYSVKMLHQQGMEKITIGADARGRGGKTMTLLEYYLENYRKKTDNSVKSLSVFLNAPDNTRGSIASMLETKIRYFLLNTDVLNMTAENSFELEDLANQKTALFIGVHDEKSTFHQLVTIMISQIYEELIKESRKHPKDLRLPIPISIFWDEFANGASWQNIDNALTAGRSRGIRFYLFIQGFGQLENLYGDKKTKTIIDNCVDLVYILAGDESTVERVSKMCGQRIVYNGKSRQTVPVFSADRLRRLSLGESVSIRQRMNPYLTRSKGVQGFNFADYYKSHKLDTGRPQRNVPPAKYFDISEFIIMRMSEDKLHIEESKRENRDVVINQVITVDPDKLRSEFTPMGGAITGIYVRKADGEYFKKSEGGTLIKFDISEMTGDDEEVVDD